MPSCALMPQNRIWHRTPDAATSARQRAGVLDTRCCARQGADLSVVKLFGPTERRVNFGSGGAVSGFSWAFCCGWWFRRAHRHVRERGPGLPAVRRVRTRLCRQRRGQHGLKPQPARSCPVALPAGRGELRRPPMTIAGTPQPARGRERIPIEEECHDRQPDG